MTQNVATADIETNQEEQPAPTNNEDEVSPTILQDKPSQQVEETVEQAEADAQAKKQRGHRPKPVSYTPPTLPTILRVDTLGCDILVTKQ